MPLTSAELPGYDHEVGPMFLRWRRRGWIRSLPDHRGREVRGSGNYRTWPDWTRRMVSLLLGSPGAPTPSGPGLDSYSVTMFTTADALAEWPDVPWLVWIEDQGRMAPAWTAADAVEIALAQPGPLRTIVSPPA